MLKYDIHTKYSFLIPFDCNYMTVRCCDRRGKIKETEFTDHSVDKLNVFSHRRIKTHDEQYKPCKWWSTISFPLRQRNMEAELPKRAFRTFLEHTQQFCCSTDPSPARDRALPESRLRDARSHWSLVCSSTLIGTPELHGKQTTPVR